MSVVAAGKALRVRIEFPATTIGGMMLVAHLGPVLEPFFAESARVVEGRNVWVVELPDGVGVGAVVMGYDLQLRADEGRLVVVVPQVVAMAVAMKMRSIGVACEVRADQAGAGVVVGAGRVDLGLPVVGAVVFETMR